MYKKIKFMIFFYTFLVVKFDGETLDVCKIRSYQAGGFGGAPYWAFKLLSVDFRREIIENKIKIQNWIINRKLVTSLFPFV